MPPTHYLLTRKEKYTDRSPDRSESLDGILGLAVESAVHKIIPWTLVSSYFRLSGGKVLVKFEIEGSHVFPGFSSEDVRHLSEFVSVQEIPEERYEELLLQKLNAKKAT